MVLRSVNYPNSTKQCHNYLLWVPWKYLQLWHKVACHVRGKWSKRWKDKVLDEEFWVELAHHLWDMSTKRYKQHSIKEKTILWTSLLSVSRVESVTQDRAGRWAILNAANEGTKFNSLEKIAFQRVVLARSEMKLPQLSPTLLPKSTFLSFLSTCDIWSHPRMSLLYA